MDAKEFIDNTPREDVLAVCERAGTTFSYLRHIAYGNRNASVKLARRLVEASDGKLSAAALVGLETA